MQKGRRSRDVDGRHRYLLCKNPLRILNWHFLQEPGQAIIRKWRAGTKPVVAHKRVFSMVLYSMAAMRIDNITTCIQRESLVEWASSWRNQTMCCDRKKKHQNFVATKKEFVCAQGEMCAHILDLLPLGWRHWPSVERRFLRGKKDIRWCSLISFTGPIYRRFFTKWDCLLRLKGCRNQWCPHWSRCKSCKIP